MKLSNIINRVSGLGSEKWAVHIDGKMRAARGEKLIFLSIGEPDAPPPEAILDVINTSMRAGRTHYAPSRGEANMLDALEAHYRKSTRRPITRNQFIFLPGTQTALFAAMMATVELGDDVLMADPYYATYEGVIAAAGGNVVPVPLSPDNGFHLRPQDLEKAITPKSRVLLLNSPSNPTGAVLPADTIKAIGEICRARDLWIISDEVYATQTYGNTVFSSPFDFDWLEERTIVVSSISKSHAMPGFRSGWMAGSEDFIAQAVSLTETMLFGSQPFLEDGAAYALSHHFAEVDAMRHNYEARGRAFLKGLEGAKNISARMPEGGMFMMADIRKTGLSGEAFARKLAAEHNVITMPGESFGAGGAGHIRIALTVDEQPITEAATRMALLADSLSSS